MENFNINIDNLSTEEKKQLMKLINKANRGKKCIVISYEEEGETSFGTLKDKECFFSQRNGALYLKIFAEDLKDYNINCINAIGVVNGGLTRFGDDELVVRVKRTIEKKRSK